jgi:hypothetical protein
MKAGLARKQGLTTVMMWLSALLISLPLQQRHGTHAFLL